jgi:hypothetical protein
MAVKNDEIKMFRPGSRKNKTYTRFVRVGPEQARIYARKAGIKPGTLQTWINTWTRARRKKAA